MKSELRYVVTLTYREGECENTGTHPIGSYESIWDARAALDVYFHKSCDRLGIEELNAISFKDEDEFLLRDAANNYCFNGEIHQIMTETEMDIFNDDEEDDEPQPDKPKYQQVASRKELIGKVKEQVDECAEPVEVIITLNGGGYTRYGITFADEEDEHGDPKFEIFSYCDESTQVLSWEECFDEDKTNIGKAIEKGSLYYVL